MNVTEIEINLKKMLEAFNKESFIFDLLLAYGLPKASIKRLREGNLNLSKIEGEISWKKKLFFREEKKEDLHLTILEIVEKLKYNERFVIVTDYKTLLAVDTKTDDKLDCVLKDLLKHYDFFLPWAGMEKAQHANENPADVKAAEKMAKLFDEIKKDNADDSLEFAHGLNVFLSRLLFCFFAEDTHIFEDNQFTNAIDSHTQTDGSDLNTYLDNLFVVFNTPEKDRKNLPKYLKAFPYVNGGLFKDKIAAPIFSRNSRSAILSSGTQDWSAINPDIFGSMFQAVISTDQRGCLGQHYTSVPNIMKVIKPLFLNEFYEELENAKGNLRKLKSLLNRIHNLKVFDPACGSGNFLIIAYKELRILEMKIFKQLGGLPLSGIQLSHFYGIEIDDFAGEIAKLALWLAEHQMNVEFLKEFGRTNPTLPLKEAGKIVQGNATRLDWEDVCPKTKDSEIYILGNPPYLGSSMQDEQQKLDLSFVCNELKKYRNLDYIANWFKKGSDYIQNTKNEFAFVSTNSICQGEQVGLLWPFIFSKKLEISFAYQSFKWQNNAKSKAAVIVVIIGVRSISNLPKYIVKDNILQNVKNINPYLTEGKSSFLFRRSTPLSNLPIMMKGNYATDDGNLILNLEEKDELIKSFPKSKKFIKRYVGSQEFIKNIERWCLWIKDEHLQIARAIEPINKRINLVSQFRKQSKAPSTREKAVVGHKFIQIQSEPRAGLIIPSVSSERRSYIPVGFVDNDTVVNAQCLVTYDAESYIFSIVTSRMHMVWVRAVAGRLKSDYRYSSALCFYGFPFPSISKQRKNEITQLTFRILDEREKYCDKTLAQLYDPEKMPEGLREAHHQNDEIIEKCYRSTPFKSDEERLEYLFKLYDKMIAEEKEENTLFEKVKKTRKKRK